MTDFHLMIPMRPRKSVSFISTVSDVPGGIDVMAVGKYSDVMEWMIDLHKTLTASINSFGANPPMGQL